MISHEAAGCRWAGSLAALLLGAAIGCSHGSGSPGNNSGTPSSPDIAKTPRMEVEPSAAILVPRSTCHLTRWGFSNGSKFHSYFTDGSGGGFKINPNINSDPGNDGGIHFSGGLPNPKSAWFSARTTEGLQKIEFRGGPGMSLVKEVELKVIAAPEGYVAYVEQRAVTLSIRQSAILTVAVPDGKPRGLHLAPAEPIGGKIEPYDGTNPRRFRYTAPGVPGTFHMVLTCPQDASVSDKVEIKVVSPDL